jgi:hypothetical protein
VPDCQRRVVHVGGELVRGIRARGGRRVGIPATGAHTHGHKNITGLIRITIHTSRVIRLAAAAHSALLYRSTGSRMRGAGGNVQFLLTCSSLMPVPHQISATPTASSAACRPTASRSSHSPALSPNSSTFPLKSYPAVQQLLLPCARADTVTQTFSRRCKRRVEGEVPGRRYRAQTRPCGWETCLTGR